MKKQLITVFLLLVFGLTISFAQQDSIALKYATTITQEDLSKHLHIIASDEYGGRETGKESLTKAATYISNFYKEIGIPPIKDIVYYQTYKVGVQEATGVSITYDNKTFIQNKDFYTFPTYLENNQFNAEVIFAGYGIDDSLYSDYTNLDVKGKVVIILNGEPKNKNERYWVSNTDTPSKWSNKRNNPKIATAKEKGALALLIINKNTPEMIKTYTHFIESEKLQVLDKSEIDYDFPSFYISSEMADEIISKSSQKLKEKINSKGVPESFTIKNKLNININKETLISDAHNVLAYIEGSDLKDELIILSAHYDHIGEHNGKIFNGADDDGSGTVAIMEIAEAFIKAKKDGNGPRRSILVLNVSGEEKGLLGSKYYTNYPIFPLENTVANLNIDMIGRLDEKHADNENYIYIIGSDMLSNDLHEINEKANATYTQLELDYEFNTTKDPNRYYYRSDHYNFAKNNIPVIFYFNGVHEDYHKETDTVDKIIFSKMEKITRLVFHTAWDLANRNERIQLNVSE
ncbi:MAG TPA: M28 family peptidase [Vicingaceae bacterium]